MSDWKAYIEDDDRSVYHQKKKVNKETCCKKNKLNNNKFGPHIYKPNEDTCILCGHIRKERTD